MNQLTSSIASLRLALNLQALRAVIITAKNDKRKNIVNQEYSMDEKLQRLKNRRQGMPNSASKEIVVAAKDDSMEYDEPIRFNLKGMPFNVENKQGTFRSGIDENGNDWEVQLQDHYGEIDGTIDADGDPVDCFINPELDEDNGDLDTVFVIDQVSPHTGEFDEHKAMIGYCDLEDATEAYLRNYEDDWQGLGAICPVSWDNFVVWLKYADTTEPFSGIDFDDDDGIELKDDSQADPSKQRHWITTHGSHILVNGNGEVVAGAGGKLAGKKFSIPAGSKDVSKHIETVEKIAQAGYEKHGGDKAEYLRMGRNKGSSSHFAREYEKTGNIPEGHLREAVTKQPEPTQSPIESQANEPQPSTTTENPAVFSKAKTEVETGKAEDLMSRKKIEDAAHEMAVAENGVWQGDFDRVKHALNNPSDPDYHAAQKIYNERFNNAYDVAVQSSIDDYIDKSGLSGSRRNELGFALKFKPEPVINGSEKQIAYAESIKKTVVDFAKKAVDKSDNMVLSANLFDPHGIAKLILSKNSTFIIDGWKNTAWKINNGDFNNLIEPKKQAPSQKEFGINNNLQANKESSTLSSTSQNEAAINEGGKMKSQIKEEINSNNHIQKAINSGNEHLLASIRTNIIAIELADGDGSITAQTFEIMDDLNNEILSQIKNVHGENSEAFSFFSKKILDGKKKTAAQRDSLKNG